MVKYLCVPERPYCTKYTPVFGYCTPCLGRLAETSVVRRFPIASGEPAPHESSFLMCRYSTSSFPGRSFLLGTAFCPVSAIPGGTALYLDVPIFCLKSPGLPADYLCWASLTLTGGFPALRLFCLGPVAISLKMFSHIYQRLIHTAKGQDDQCRNPQPKEPGMPSY